MKKFLVMLLVLALLLSATACGKSKENDDVKTEVQTGNSAQAEKPAATEPKKEPEQKIDPENWGLENTYSVKNNDIAVLYTINTPYYFGTDVGDGILCEQMDGTMTLVSGQKSYSPAVDSAADLFPAYKEQVEFTMVGGYGLLAEGFEFTFGEGKPVQVGDYEMYTFEGKVTFKVDTTPMDFTFIAYATTLKSNGGYAYWMVFDITKDHSAGKLIAEHAYNMALTFREEQ